MKLPELKNRLKNKYVVKVVAGVLTIALVGGCVGTYTVKAEKNDTVVSEEGAETTEAEEVSEDDSLEDELLGKVSVSKKDMDKEETVYFITDASGNVDKTIVSDHLYNRDGKDTIEDVSSLSDIENVKGDEEFSQDGDKLQWKADGNDIYYQGTTNAEAPVSQKVTYYLDGKEISPEDLAGKSGKVTIHFDYTNNTSYTETVNGEKVTVSVPFAAITGLVLDDSFSNIEVTNGDVKENNGSSIVLGYALPGLSDSLDVEDSDFADGVTIPDYFEVTADVEDFSLSTAMTFVVNAANYVGVEGASLDSVDDLLDELSDATEQLQDGSAELADGADTLADGAKTLKDGMSTLKTGLASYTDGANQINTGLNTLNSSVPSLTSGIATLNSSAKSLSDGVALLNSTVSAQFTDSEKQALVAQVDGTIASQKSAVEAQAADTVNSQAEGIKSQVSASVDTQADTIKSQVSASVDAQADTIKSQVASSVDAQADTIKSQVSASVDAQADTIKSQVTGAVESTFNAGLTSEIAGTAASTLKANTQLITVLTNGVTPMVQAGFTQEVANAVKAANLPFTVTDYSSAVVAFDTMKGQQGAAEAYVQTLISQNVDQIIADLSGSVADTAKTVSEQVAASTAVETSKTVAGNAAVEASKTVAAEAAVTTAKSVAGEAAVTASKSVAGEAAVTAAGQAAATAAYTGAVSGAEQAAVSAAEQTKSTVAVSINATQANGYSLVTGMQALAAGTQTLADSAPALTSGITQLVNGSNTLVSNNKTLLDGANQLADGTVQLSDGANTLAEGSHTLADGIVEFNEKGINKILDTYNGDIEPLANKLQATLDAGADYQSYAGIADGANGSVKFVYKLASIKTADAE